MRINPTMNWTACVFLSVDPCISFEVTYFYRSTAGTHPNCEAVTKWMEMCFRSILRFPRQRTGVSYRLHYNWTKTRNNCIISAWNPLHLPYKSSLFTTYTFLKDLIIIKIHLEFSNSKNFHDTKNTGKNRAHFAQYVVFQSEMYLLVPQSAFYPSNWQPHCIITELCLPASYQSSVWYNHFWKLSFSANCQAASLKKSGILPSARPAAKKKKILFDNG